MARYNHFSKNRYAQVIFSSIGIGEKFRMDKRKDGRLRADIIMIKTSALSYMELKSQKEYTLVHGNFEVSSFDCRLTPTPSRTQTI